MRIAILDDYQGVALRYVACLQLETQLSDAFYRDVSATLDVSFGGIAPNHVPVLACLEQQGSQTVTDLTRRMGVGQPAVTRMVGALKQLGLVHLEATAHDQRQSFVVMTEAGEALVTRMKTNYWPPSTPLRRRCSLVRGVICWRRLRSWRRS